MPAILVTAVDTTANTLTATAHGLTTGDRFRLRNVGGVLPAASPALAGATDYFAIRVDANTVKVSDTNAHAVAGTGIFDLTGTGTGTTTVEYGPPYAVPRIAAPRGQVFSDDANATWQALVALYGLLTGQTQTTYSGVTLRAQPAESTLTPIVQHQDWSSRGRATVDHFGLRQGQVTEWEETWRTTGSTMPTGWTATLATSGTAAIADPSSTFAQRSAALSVAASAGSSAILTHEFMAYVDNNRVLTFECTVLLPSIAVAGTRGNTLEMGIQFSHAGANDFFAIFRVNTTSANWRAVVIGSSTTDDDTSYAVDTSGAIARLKLELSGSSQSGASAGTFTARFFIDGQLRTTRTFSSPGADKVRPYFKHSTSGVAIGSGSLIVGRPRICFNHLAAGDIW